MLQGMNNIEAGCLFNVKVGMFTHLEQSTISLFTVNIMGMVSLTIQHKLIISISLK
jgi:hypothetical protein